MDVAILLSSKGVTWSTAASMKCDTNSGSDKRLFFSRTKVNFPAAPNAQIGPRPWGLALTAGLRVTFGAGAKATSPIQSLYGFDFGVPPHFDPDKTDAQTRSDTTALIYCIR